MHMHAAIAKYGRSWTAMRSNAIITVREMHSTSREGRVANGPLGSARAALVG